MPTSGKSSIPAELEVFAREEGIEMLVAGMSLAPDDKSKKSRALLYSASSGWHGDLVNSGTLEILTKKDQAILTVSDRVSHSACRLKSLAAGGARLFLVAGDSAHDELKYELLRDRLLLAYRRRDLLVAVAIVVAVDVVRLDRVAALREGALEARRHQRPDRCPSEM